MNKIAESNMTGNPVSAFLDNTHCSRILDWNDEIGHPYFWPWADDIFREQVIHCLLDSGKRQADHAGRDMLRWLLYRFRTAQRRRRANNMPDDFRAYRWTWATHAEVTADTFLSEDQIRRAVDRLEARGLVRVVVDSRLRWVPHYRPSNDLFRVARALTMFSDWEVVVDYNRVMDPTRSREESGDYLRSFLSIMRRGPLLDMVRDFAVSDAPDRAEAFIVEFGAAMKAAEAELER